MVAKERENWDSFLVKEKQKISEMREEDRRMMREEDRRMREKKISERNQKTICPTGRREERLISSRTKALFKRNKELYNYL